MNVGFIGLGIMGSRMAANLQAHGHVLVVTNRTAERAAPLVENGAIWAESPAAVAARADIVFTMLSEPHVVSEAALGRDGLLHRLRPGGLWINCTTVDPAFARQMDAKTRARGVRYLDAPVTGSREPAARGDLVFIVGGDVTDLESCRSLLQAMGSRIVHVGGVGMGSSMKIINNLIGGVAMAGFAEGAALGAALGITPETIFEVMTGGVMLAPFIALKHTKIETRDFDTEFSTRWLNKDLHLATITAYEAGTAMPVVNAAKELYRLAASAGYADEDFSSVYAFLTQQPPQQPAPRPDGGGGSPEGASHATSVARHR